RRGSRREAGASRERRYYKRVRSVAATTSWGVALTLWLSVVVTAQTQTQTAPPVPPQTPPAAATPPAKPATPPSPAPPAPLYDQAWSVPIDVGRPIRLAAVTHAVLVADASSIAAFSLADDGKELWRVAADPITAVAADDTHVVIGDGASLRS